MNENEEKEELYFDSEEEKRIVNNYICSYLPNELLYLEKKLVTNKVYYDKNSNEDYNFRLDLISEMNSITKFRNRLKIIYYYGLYKESILYNDFSKLLSDIFSMFPDIYFDSPEEFRNCKYIKLAFVESGV